MKSQWLMVCVCLIAGGCMAAGQNVQQMEAMRPDQIKAVMTRVADWQLANPSRHHSADWTSAALYTGMMAWSKMADSDKYEKAMMQVGEKNNWKLHRHIFFADDHAVGQMYLELYEKHQDPRMITPTREQFDHILANPPTEDLKMVNGVQLRWNWCDALFMAPPVLAKLSRLTGDPKYLDYMNSEWWLTTDFLYDEEEHLYYRDSRFFDQREKNGQKIFWSRGNGWVIAGIARVLDEMPSDYPDRPRYEKLFKEMAAKIKAIQSDEGMWHPSLLDPETYSTKESSGSGFYCYGLAWGINNGYLDEAEYLPAVIKAWTGLVRCVHPDGKLGYVQPIGADPRHVNADQTEIYGVGSFLLAGSQVYQIAMRRGAETATVTVKNPIPVFRDAETVSLDWAAAAKTVPGLTKDNAAVYDVQTNAFLVTQFVEIDGRSELLFQDDFAPGQTKVYRLMKQPEGVEKPRPQTTTYCCFLPERKDDMAWENDKVANRMYGPALEYETITNGIDAWVKCVQYPVVEKFIRAYVQKGLSYHAFHGEGADVYKVGNTLGCGAMAPLIDNKVSLPPKNFAAWDILANGPIRSTFELSYKPWKAGAYTVGAKIRVSIDLGSNMSRMESYYSSDDTQTLPLAAGIVLRDTSKQTWTADDAIAYWLPTDIHDYGMMGCGVVFSKDYETQTVTADNHLLLTVKQTIDKPAVYYTGSCWDRNAQFSSFDKWQQYLKTFKNRLDNPVVVELKK